MSRASLVSESITPFDSLIAGPSDLIASKEVTLSSGQNLARGAVLGKVTATGEYILSLSAAVDGSQTPDAILAEATDATAADAKTVAYIRGDFGESALTLGAGHTMDSIREGLRDKGIHLVKVHPAT